MTPYFLLNNIYIAKVDVKSTPGPKVAEVVPVTVVSLVGLHPVLRE